MTEYRPELPDIFPDGKVVVEGEEHVYEVTEGTSGSTLEKDTYLLNKAPLKPEEDDAILSVSGTSRETNEGITFQGGVDYQLDDYVETEAESFTYDSTDATYVLEDQPDVGSVEITDENGVSYVNGTDFSVSGSTITWDTNETTPTNGDTFEARYTLTTENAALVWLNGDDLPKANTVFFVDYRVDSLISRVLDSSEDELDNVSQQLTDAVNARLLDTAEGDELDEIGKLFGDLIGKRGGRSDQDYRIYLKSVVQSFISRGTVTGIKLAISAATSIPIEDIEIDENFEDVEYEIIIRPTTPVSGSVIEQVAEIADPSGVELLLTRFAVEEELTEINDGYRLPDGTFQRQPRITEGQQFAEDMTVSDATASIGIETPFQYTFIDDVANESFNKESLSDDFTSDDTGQEQPKSADEADQLSADDAAVEAAATTAADDASSNDTVTNVTENSVTWGTNTCGTMTWATSQ